jgi:DDE superfamily endonuclease
VAAILRVMGLAESWTFHKYHRVLSRAKWSGLQGAKILLGLLVGLAQTAGVPLLLGIDETIERRKGKKIKAKGKYRDAVRSTQSVVVKCYGLKWIGLMMLIPLPWSKRYWALPFLTLLAPSGQANERAGKPHKTTVEWRYGWSTWFRGGCRMRRGR